MINKRVDFFSEHVVPAAKLYFYANSSDMEVTPNIPPLPVIEVSTMAFLWCTKYDTMHCFTHQVVLSLKIYKVLRYKALIKANIFYLQFSDDLPSFPRQI